MINNYQQIINAAAFKDTLITLTNNEGKITIDLEVIVHAYDFHMTRKETYEYIDNFIRMLLID